MISYTFHVSLLRVAQLEVQLFEAFFVEGNMIDEASSNQNSNDDILHTSTDNSSNKQTTNGNSIEGAYKHREVLVVLETMCSIVGDSLRPSIIHETDVDELCGVVGMFALVLPDSSGSMAKMMMSILTSASLLPALSIHILLTFPSPSPSRFSFLYYAHYTLL